MSPEAHGRGHPSPSFVYLADDGSPTSVSCVDGHAIIGGLDDASLKSCLLLDPDLQHTWTWLRSRHSQKVVVFVILSQAQVPGAKSRSLSCSCRNFAIPRVLRLKIASQVFWIICPVLAAPRSSHQPRPRHGHLARPRSSTSAHAALHSPRCASDTTATHSTQPRRPRTPSTR